MNLDREIIMSEMTKYNNDIRYYGLCFVEYNGSVYRLLDDNESIGILPNSFNSQWQYLFDVIRKNNNDIKTIRGRINNFIVDIGNDV